MAITAGFVQVVTRIVSCLQEQGAERYILDVRNNGGGSFPAGIQVCRFAGIVAAPMLCPSLTGSPCCGVLALMVLPASPAYWS